MLPRLGFLLLLASVALPQPLAVTGPATLFLVRHAERAGGADDDPLTNFGQERAATLKRTLGEADVRKIVVSETLRSRQTAEPLAAALKQKPIVIKRGALAELTAELRKSVGNGSIVAVRHADEIPALVEALAGPPLKVPAYGDQEYDRLLVLTLIQGRAINVRTLRFGR
jgi:2,3-bisphosphoglycerate-dependent phosphoglycerate mutase